MVGFYESMVEAAAGRAAETGIVDIVDLAKAAECGFDTNTFAADVADAISQSMELEGSQNG